MPVPNIICVGRLARLAGMPTGPALIGARPDAEFAGEPLFIPCNLRWPSTDIPSWESKLRGRTDDLEQLEAGMLLYNAIYRRCRDATGETHNRISHPPAKVRAKDKVQS